LLWHLIEFFLHVISILCCWERDETCILLRWSNLKCNVWNCDIWWSSQNFAAESGMEPAFSWDDQISNATLLEYKFCQIFNNFWTLFLVYKSPKIHYFITLFELCFIYWSVLFTNKALSTSPRASQICNELTQIRI
jgi:hypothetical protein